MDDWQYDPDTCAPDCQERAECPTVGAPGHMQCGWCEEHRMPYHHCGGAKHVL